MGDVATANFMHKMFNFRTSIVGIQDGMALYIVGLYHLVYCFCQFLVVHIVNGVFVLFFDS